MAKMDFKKTFREEYSASSKRPRLLDVAEHSYIMMDGKGDPNTSESFKNGIEALFSVSYDIKFSIKKEDPINDYTVMPLEGLWWSDNMENFIEDKGSWNWTIMIMQPDFVSDNIFLEAINSVMEKKGLASLKELRFAKYHDGLSAQIMHVGPFSEEGPTIKALHEFISDSGHERRGKHREIYLSDMRRIIPEKYKTILRQPIKPI